MTTHSAQTPDPPYYAVIFTSQRTSLDQGYEATANRMYELAHQQEGCLGAESIRNEKGFGVTISYWKDQAAILAWKKNAEHLIAQKKGRSGWYNHYKLRICRVERDYEFNHTFASGTV